MSIRMTEKAAERFKTACAGKSLPIETTRLRVDAERGRDPNELRISLKFDMGDPRQDDLVENTDGAQLVVNQALADALGDRCLDFKEDGPGFVLERLTV